MGGTQQLRSVCARLPVLPVPLTHTHTAVRYYHQIGSVIIHDMLLQFAEHTHTFSLTHTHTHTLTPVRIYYYARISHNKLNLRLKCWLSGEKP